MPKIVCQSKLYTHWLKINLFYQNKLGFKEPNVRKQACTSVGFTVISFHGQIGPSQLLPLINQIVPQFWYKTRCEARLFSLWLK